MFKNKQKLTARGLGIAALLMGGVLLQASHAQAQTPTFDPAKVKQGLAIAPVALNMAGLDANLVGYGSYRNERALIHVEIGPVTGEDVAADVADIARLHRETAA